MVDSYYVLNSPGQGTNVVIRIDTPAGSNVVGTQWTQVLAERWNNLGSEEQMTQYPGKNVNQLSNGQQLEIQFLFIANTARPGIVAELEAAVASRIIDEKAVMATQYQFWGKEG